MIETISVAGGILLLAFIIKSVYTYKMNKLKIEASLRMSELERGYQPGTYSKSFSSRRSRKEFKREFKRMAKEGFSFKDPAEAEREDLERGIKDLEERMRNLDEILRERKSDAKPEY